MVFDAQGSRMAMTLIEQLQGKTLPHCPPTDVVLQEPGLRNKCHSFIRKIVYRLLLSAHFRAKPLFFFGYVACFTAIIFNVLQLYTRMGLMQECVDSRLHSNWAQAFILSRFWKWHPICHQWLNEFPRTG